MKLLNKMCTDKFGKSYRDMDDNFNLYIKISENATNAMPKEILENHISFFLSKNHQIFLGYTLRDSLTP